VFAQQAPQPPPPLAFRTATLYRHAHAIDVQLMAVARTSVRVTVTRKGLRLGRGVESLDRGYTAVRVPIGPKTARKLRRGLIISIAIEYGAPLPVRARPTLLLAAPADDPVATDDGPLTA
jgi:hypothetical protein